MSYHTATKSQVTGTIFKFILIDASVICHIRLIHWIEKIVISIWGINSVSKEVSILYHKNLETSVGFMVYSH